MQLLVRNKVEDFDRWKSVFDANLEPPHPFGWRVGGPRGVRWRNLERAHLPKGRAAKQRVLASFP